MKRCKLYSRTALLSGALVVLLMSGCATVQENPMVTSARESFNKVQSDPAVNKLAPLELQEAKKAIAITEASVASRADQEEVDHLAYMAKQKSLIAGQVTTMKIADQEMETANAERNKILLGARTKEAELFYSQAELARQDAEAQRRAAEAALNEAQLSSAEAEKARMEAAEAEARTQKLQAQLADLEAKQTERGLVLTLGDVLFDTGKSELKEGAYSVIEKMTAFMKEYPARKVQIEGFTDSVGSDDYNLGLSIRRAESVRNALSGRGVELDRIMYRGYGEGFPVASNDTREGRQRNRRVEIVISDEKGMITERTR